MVSYPICEIICVLVDLLCDSIGPVDLTRNLGLRLYDVASEGDCSARTLSPRSYSPPWCVSYLSLAFAAVSVCCSVLL